MTERAPNGNFFRSREKQRQGRTPEQDATERRSEDADRIALRLHEELPTDPVDQKQADEDYEAWSMVKDKGADEVREYLLGEESTDESLSRRLAYTLRWFELRGL